MQYWGLNQGLVHNRQLLCAEFYRWPARHLTVKKSNKQNDMLKSGSNLLMCDGLA